jgi:hypothetical protein
MGGSSKAFRNLVIVWLVLAAVNLAHISMGLAQTPLSSESTGTIKAFTVARQLPASNASMNLSFDIDWLYRASSLLGEPVINCGLRVRDVRGEVSFTFDGEQHRVAVTQANAELVDIVSLSFLMVYARGLVADTVLRCGEGVIARDGTEPFNVASGLSWRSIFCRVPHNTQKPLPARLEHDWCLQGLGGEYLDPDSARSIYDGVLAHNVATPRIAAATIGVTRLIIAEQKQLREKAATEATLDGRETTDEKTQPSSPYDRLSRVNDGTDDASKSGERASPVGDNTSQGTDFQLATALEEANAEVEETWRQGRRACRGNPPVLEPEPDDASAEAEQARVLEACSARADPFVQTIVCDPNPSPCPYGGCLRLITPCTSSMIAHNRSASHANEVRRSQIAACEQKAEAAHTDHLITKRATVRARNQETLTRWEQVAAACEMRADEARAAAIAEHILNAEKEARRRQARRDGLSGLRGINAR